MFVLALSLYNTIEFKVSLFYAKSRTCSFIDGEDKNMFSYEFMKEVEYIELKKSKKFTPALYYERNGFWEGGSTSQFSPVMIFKLWEKFSDTCLEVFESMEVNGKRTFGYDVPIVYKRV